MDRTTCVENEVEAYRRFKLELHQAIRSNFDPDNTRVFQAIADRIDDIEAAVEEEDE